MYEAPDRYKRLISARLPGGESAGLASDESSSESSPLRDVQLMSRALLAPFFAAANIIASLLMAEVLWTSTTNMLVQPWAAGVVGLNLAAMQLARTQAITCVGRSGRRVPQWLMVGEVVGRGVVWLSLPLYLFTSLQPSAQVVAASLTAGLGIGALGLVVVPPCATAWMISFTAGVVGALFMGRHSVPFQHMLSIVFTIGVAIFGVLTVARWAFRQLTPTAAVSSHRDRASRVM